MKTQCAFNQFEINQGIINEKYIFDSLHFRKKSTT